MRDVCLADVTESYRLGMILSRQRLHQPFTVSATPNTLGYGDAKTHPRRSGCGVRDGLTQPAMRGNNRGKIEQTAH